MVLLVLLGLTVIALIWTNRKMEAALVSKDSSYRVYGKHYALIMDNPNDEVATKILDGCRKEGGKADAYVEAFGIDLENEYSAIDLVDMAIDAKVDGIILEAKEEDSYRQIIQKAWENQIPVITVLEDCMDSARKSYVGIGAYDLGREYARQIIREANKNEHRLLVLMDTDTADSTQNIICNGIRETLNNEGNHLRMDMEIAAVDSQSSFAAEDSIRKMLAEMEELPDYIVCLNEKDTMVMYNTVVNYNIVGKVKVLGFYTSQPILQAVDKGIITSTISIDYEGMGEACVEALNEYFEIGNVNGYFLMDSTTVNSTNVKEYLKNEADEK